MESERQRENWGGGCEDTREKVGKCKKEKT